MLVRKCDNCGREFDNGDTVYLIKRRTVKNVIDYKKGTSVFEPIYGGTEYKPLSDEGLFSDSIEGNEEWCEHCATAVNNALKSIAEGENNVIK